MPRVVFVFAPGDLNVFASVDSAAAWVEAIDVDAGEYDFFAEDGTVLVATTHDYAVSLRVSSDRQPDVLRDRLRQFLSHPRVAMEPSLADNPVEAAQAILNAQWERRPFKWFPWLDRRANGAAPPAL